MSFMLTIDQVKNKTKTVTRRTGWTFLKPGDGTIFFSSVAIPKYQDNTY
jgi:hypothetical protein